MRKNILIAAFVFPAYSFAGIGFISQGVGHYCYQDFSSAMDAAQKNADRNAENRCGAQKAWRISQFATVGAGSYCSIKVQAEYICQ